MAHKLLTKWSSYANPYPVELLKVSVQAKIPILFANIQLLHKHVLVVKKKNNNNNNKKKKKKKNNNKKQKQNTNKKNKNKKKKKKRLINILILKMKIFPFIRDVRIVFEREHSFRNEILRYANFSAF